MCKVSNVTFCQSIHTQFANERECSRYSFSSVKSSLSIDDHKMHSERSVFFISLFDRSKILFSRKSPITMKYRVLALSAKITCWVPADESWRERSRAPFLIRELSVYAEERRRRNCHRGKEKERSADYLIEGKS